MLALVQCIHNDSIMQVTEYVGQLKAKNPEDTIVFQLTFEINEML